MPGGAPRHTSDDIFDAVVELRERVSRLEERVETLSREVEAIASIKADIASINQKVEDLDKKLDEFMQMYIKQLASNHRMLKFVLMLVGMVLSFLAALFGLHWAPP